MNRLRKTVLALSALVLQLPLAAHAIDLPTTDQGRMTWATSSVLPSMLAHDPDDTTMYVTSLAPLKASIIGVSYALFDIPAALGAIQDASLSLQITVTGLNVATGGRLSVWDVTSPLSAFQVAYSVPTTPGMALFDDLAGGVAYATGVQVPVGPGTVTFNLPGTALAAIGAAQGGTFGIGFSGQADGLGNIELADPVLHINAVPEPASVALLAVGLLALGGQLRRRPGARA